MGIKKTIIGLMLSLLLSSGIVVAADFGKGMDAYESGDYKAALVEWTPLAEQGNADAQVMLGTMYELGEGVLMDAESAVKWYTLAAQQGQVDAQYAMGYLYSQGEGVPTDAKTAAKWYTLAGEQGNAEAQYYLGTMYEYGEGVPRMLRAQ